MSCLEQDERRIRDKILIQAAIWTLFVWLGVGIWWSLLVLAVHVVIAKPFSHICAYMYAADAKFYREHGHCPCKSCCDKHGTPYHGEEKAD